MKHFEVGDLIDDRYQLRREVARGGGGVVFEAVQRYTTRTVAIKLLLEEQQAQPRSGVRLLREARALTMARHKNIVSVLDAGQTKEHGPYLVMELLEGKPLDGILAARGTLKAADAAWVVSQVADGTAKLHRHSLVHRDIKPSNVFIKYTDEGDECVTLLDFGAATHSELEERERITQENSLLGTPEYMSPEQLMSSSKPTAAMDIYGLGVLLYECLLGDVPYQGTYGEILLKVHSQAPTAFFDAKERLPAGLRKILDCALALAPEDRFPSADSMASALRRELSAMEGVPSSLLGLAEAEGAKPVARRQYTRAPYVTPVLLILKDGNSFEGQSQDLSTGGVLVLAPKECSHELVENLEFTLPPDGAVARVRVVGRWAKLARTGKVAGFQFQDLSEPQSEKIRAYVASMVSRHSENPPKTAPE